MEIIGRTDSAAKIVSVSVACPGPKLRDIMKAAAMFVCGDVTGARHYLAGEAKLTAHGANGEFVMALSNGNGANPMKLFVR